MGDRRVEQPAQDLGGVDVGEVGAAAGAVEGAGPPAVGVVEQGGVGDVGPRRAEDAVQGGDAVAQRAGVRGPVQQPEALGAQAVEERGAHGGRIGIAEGAFVEDDRAEPVDAPGADVPVGPGDLVVVGEQRGADAFGELAVGGRGEPDPAVPAAGGAVGDGDGEPFVVGEPAGRLDRGAARHEEDPATGGAAPGEPFRVGERDDLGGPCPGAGRGRDEPFQASRLRPPSAGTQGA